MAVMVVAGNKTTALLIRSQCSVKHMITNHSGYYVLYRDNQGLWRWTFHAANNRAIAVSSESYFNKTDCTAAINLIAASGGCAIHER